jgi:hypothetical protein
MRIGVIDQQTYEQWTQKTLFATYAWNASPVDGTDIIRSFAAKARTFCFPLDMQTVCEVARIPQQGEAALQHIKTMFPLWFQQKELLKALKDKRRERHRELSNRHKKQRVFQQGDLVLVRKQVTSNASKGKPAKLTLRARTHTVFSNQQVKMCIGYRRFPPYKPPNETRAHANVNWQWEWRSYRLH